MAGANAAQLKAVQMLHREEVHTVDASSTEVESDVQLMAVPKQCSVAGNVTNITKYQEPPM
jgi:hypothetical protein